MFFLSFNSQKFKVSGTHSQDFFKLHHIFQIFLNIEFLMKVWSSDSDE